MVSTRRSTHRRRSVPSAQKTPDSCLSPRSRNGSRTSSSSSSGCSLAAATACAQLSPSFRCLEQIALDMTVDEEKSLANPADPKSKQKVQAIFYVMQVRHGKCGVTWSHRRPFDDYHKFHTQLLQILKQGHVCRGDCPWLYSFLKSYFPRSSSCPLKIFCPKVIAKRREALHQCFTTLHSFLLTRENQNCDVLRGSVLKAYTAFVYGELGPSHPLMSALKINEQLAAKMAEATLATTPTCSSTEGEEDDDLSFIGSRSSSASVNEGLNSAPMCPLCRNKLDEDAGEVSFSYPIMPSTPPRATRAPSYSSSSSSASSSSTSSSRYYATKLRCGHEFHEECILQWLNQELSCPACGRSELSPRNNSTGSSNSGGGFGGAGRATSTSGAEAVQE